MAVRPVFETEEAAVRANDKRGGARHVIRLAIKNERPSKEVDSRWA